MHLIAIYGSPRENGNSDTLLDEALKGARVGIRGRLGLEKIFVRDLNIQPCSGCRACDTTGRCIISDDDMSSVYEKIENSHRIIVSAPLYFCGLPAQLKALVDRSQCYWARKYFTAMRNRTMGVNSSIPKLGAFICVGATKSNKLFEGAKHTIKYFFDVYNIKYFHELIVTGIDKKGEIKKRKSHLKQAYQLGRKIILMSNVTK
ncbi:MAG: flavodoxin family protein [Elusimicrobiota bacterium]|nr:flavodoxin family protein [Elusimicrobiota bacterium]